MPPNPPKTWLVVPYRPEWPQLFEIEASHLASVFRGSGAVIEHIGSTAVPGLGAKPIIDIMIGVPTLADAERRVSDLSRLEYEAPQSRYGQTATVDRSVALRLYRDLLRAHYTARLSASTIKPLIM